MGYVKTEIVDGRLLLVPDEAAREMLPVHQGVVLSVEMGPDGRLSLTPTARPDDERRERGRAFLGRYKSTFDALAK